MCYTLASEFPFYKSANSGTMKRIVISISTFFIGFILFLPQLNAAGGWTRIKDSDGIKVYQRPVPGTDLMEYMGVTTIDAKIEVIGEILRDVPSFNSWLSDCHSARVAKKYNRNTLVIYIVLKPPLIEVRDIVLKDSAVYDWDNAKALVSFTTTKEVNIPTEKGRVRITTMTGIFDLEFYGRNKTKFIYKLKVDPAGTIPKKLAYAVMKNYPYDTLKGLKKIANNKKYADLAKGSDDEMQIESRSKNEAYVRRILANRLSKFVKEKAALREIIAADRDGIRNIMTAGRSYDSIRKTTTNFYIKYFERYVIDKKLAAVAEKLKHDPMLIAELTDMIVSDCDATYITVDDIVGKYLNKYVK
jgi:hypothetical protein